MGLLAYQTDWVLAPCWLLQSPWKPALLVKRGTRPEGSCSRKGPCNSDQEPTDFSDTVSLHPTLIPSHFGCSEQEPFWRVRLHGGEKAGLELGRVSEHLPISSSVNTQDDKHSFLQACWLAFDSGLPATHQLQPILLWRPLLCSQQRCFLFQQQETKTCLGKTRERQPRPLVKLPEWASAAYKVARLIETCWRSRLPH